MQGGIMAAINHTDFKRNMMILCIYSPIIKHGNYTVLLPQCSLSWKHVVVTPFHLSSQGSEFLLHCAMSYLSECAQVKVLLITPAFNFCRSIWKKKLGNQSQTDFFFFYMGEHNRMWTGKQCVTAFVYTEEQILFDTTVTCILRDSNIAFFCKIAK